MTFLKRMFEMHLHQALVMSVLLYTELKPEYFWLQTETLEAFHVKCKRQMINVRWWDPIISNVEVLQRSGLPLPTISDMSPLHIPIAHLDPKVPANTDLHLIANNHKVFDLWAILVAPGSNLIKTQEDMERCNGPSRRRQR